MELRYIDIRPGKVLQVVDNYGTIKASCVGVFSEEDDPEKLPPIIPFFKTSSTSYCSPHEGDDINVWINKINPQELYYTFQGSVKKNNESELEYGSEDTEILSRHKSDEGDSSIIYAKESGWSIKDKDSGITISNDGGVEIQQGDYRYCVSVSDSGIVLSDKKTNHTEPAVLGDKLEDVLNSIVNMFDTIQQAATGNPYTSPIGGAIGSQISMLKQQVKQIKAKNVKLS